MQRLFILALCAFVFTSCQTINVNPAEEAAQESEKAQAASKEAEKEDDDDRFTPWKKVLKHTREVEGFVPFHLNKRDRSLLAEISPEQLDEDFGLVMHISQGVGVFNLHDGLRLSDTRLMRFRRVGDKIQLVHRNARFTADDGSAMQQSLEENTAHSVIRSFDIKSKNDSTGHFLIDMTDFFVSDYAQIGEGVRFYFGRKPAQLQKGKSHVEQVMGFPENVEIDASLTYKGRDNPSFGGEAIPDYRAFPVGVRYSLFKLPETPMQRRYADDRVGHFTDAVKDFSQDKTTDPYIRYVTRWRLEPEDPEALANGDLTEPKEPIVFYVDHSVPEEYRPYVKEGIEAWDKAFREAGYKNAIVAKDAPDDSTWSAEDIRHSTVQWTAAHQMGYAIGPSQTDPCTGEILNADILISSSWTRVWANEYEELLPETSTQHGFRSERRQTQRVLGERLARRLCTAERGKAHQLRVQHALLAGLGRIETGETTMPESYLGDALKDLVMHEVGHTLGLRHNFKASSGIPYEQLHDEAFTQNHGVSLSVMDYAPVNVTPNTNQQGHYWNKEVGTYDVWAINYAYTPILDDNGELAGSPDAERPALNEIAQESSDPLHTYGTDEDGRLGPYAVDPLTNTYELGSNPLRFAEDRGTLVNKVMPMLEERLISEGERYHRLRTATTSLLYERYGSLTPVMKMVGGSYVARDHKGTPNGRTPFQPVSADRQREAVRVLIDEAFAADAFQFDPDRLNKLAPDRHAHWGTNWFTTQIDFPVHDYVASVQRSLLNNLLHPARLQRMMDTAVRTDDGSEAYRPAELLTTLTGAIWSELGSGAERLQPINSFRRNLQRAYTQRLTQLMLEEVGSGPSELSVPEHVRSLARLELQELSNRLSQGLQTRQLDRDMQAHLAETKTRIDRALEASMTETFD